MSNTSAPSADEPVTFVGWQPEDSVSARKSAPRAYHKKSRAGCQQCRARRVKCDELHPICTNCQRHKGSCTWGPGTSSQSQRESTSSSPKSLEIRTRSSTRSTSPSDPPQLSEFPESKARRLSELQLLYHYMTTTATSLTISNHKSYIWVDLIPPLALKHDSLLYAIYAITALHLSRLHPDELSHVEQYQEYLGCCLRLHHDNVANLNAENADAAMLTATVLRVCSIAVLQFRHLEKEGEYVPPVEWLVLNFGTGHGLGLAAWKYLIHDESSVIRKMIGNDTPGLDPLNQSLRDDRIFDRRNITPALSALLHRTAEDEVDEPWDDNTRETYEDALAYIGSCQKAIDAAESRQTILRRLALFPALIERKFITLVQEKRERALVLLACYFSLWKWYEGIWWCGEVAVRESKAVSRAIGMRWREVLIKLTGFKILEIADG